MNRSRRLALTASVLAMLVMVTSGFASRRPAADVRIVTIGMIAEQLGVKIGYGEYKEFELGAQFTGTLEERDKLASFGLKGMHKGARVYAARVAAD